MIGNFMRAVYRELAPEGVLRIGFNASIPVLAKYDKTIGAWSGIAADLAAELARKLAVPHECISFDGAAQPHNTRAGYGAVFTSIAPACFGELDFSRPYLVLESAYLVHANAALKTAPHLDRDEVTIGVREGGFHDMHLSRKLKRARLLRSPTAQATVDALLSGDCDAIAGTRDRLTEVAVGREGLRAISGRFAAVKQAIGVPSGNFAARRYLDSFVGQMIHGNLLIARQV